MLKKRSRKSRWSGREGEDKKKYEYQEMEVQETEWQKNGEKEHKA